MSTAPKYYKDSISDENELKVDPAVMASAPYGTVLDEETVTLLLNDETWLNAQRPSGYNRTSATYVTVGLVEASNVVRVLYTYKNEGGGGTTYYNLVVKYLEEGTDEELAPSYTKRIAAGRSYDVTAQTEKFIDGYEISQITGDDITGYMNGDRESIVYYTVDIDDGETPLDPGPGGDGDGDGTDIGDGEVPLDPGPGGDGDGTDIGDENVPLVPATGDNLALWVMAAVASAAGLVYLTVAGKKREKDNT